MHRNHQTISVVGMTVLFLVLFNVVVLERGLVANAWWYKLLYVTVPLLLSFIAFRKKIF
jgi:hypothetical protein